MTDSDTEATAMRDGLLDQPLVPVADAADAEATYTALVSHVDPADTQPVVIHVRTDDTEDGRAAVERFESLAAADGMAVETEISRRGDITEAIIAAADTVDASAIVFCSRGGSAWFDLLVGGVRTSLMVKSDHPVVLLPLEAA